MDWTETERRERLGEAGRKRAERGGAGRAATSKALQQQFDMSYRQARNKAYIAKESPTNFLLGDPVNFLVVI